MVNYLITGVNRGIGLEFVKQLSSDPGNFIYGTVRSIAKAQEVPKLPNIKLIEVQLLSSLDEIKTQLQVIDHLDIVIQNAGTTNPGIFSPYIDVPEQEYIDAFDINFIASLKIYKAAFPYLYKGSGTKKFFFMSTASSYPPAMEKFNRGFSAYGVSKIGVNYLCKQIAIENTQSYNELVKKSVTIALHPGALLTPGTEEFEKLMPGAFAPVDQGITKVLEFINRHDLITGGFYDASTGEKYDF